MSKIDLLRLLEVYETNLCNKIFHYEVSNSIPVNVAFYREQFCHLLGIQHIYDYDKRYLGKAGYDKILDKQITVKALKRHNLAEYEKIKERLLYFNEIYDIMLNGTLIGFNPDVVNPKTIIKADFVLYKEHEAHYLHLFLRKESVNSNIYAPVSYGVKSFNDKEPNQFIKYQKYKKITSRSISLMSENQ